MLTYQRHCLLGARSSIDLKSRILLDRGYSIKSVKGKRATAMAEKQKIKCVPCQFLVILLLHLWCSQQFNNSGCAIGHAQWTGNIGTEWHVHVLLCELV